MKECRMVYHPAFIYGHIHSFLRKDDMKSDFLDAAATFCFLLVEDCIRVLENVC